MSKAINLILIGGFLLVDFLFFHDFLKPGEVTTPAQYLAGALSLIVFFQAGRDLVRG